MPLPVSRCLAAALPLAAAGLLLSCRPAPPPGPSEGTGLPAPDFLSASDTKERKRLFLEHLLPVIEQENARVLSRRRRLERLFEAHRRNGVLPWADRLWLRNLLAQYGVAGLEVTEESRWDNLFRRVDAVPADLAVIQAAKESGWGTSRFAREGNNYFGQRCFTEGCGMIPEDREPGLRHEVAVFDSLEEAVRSYIHNLNTNAAYRRFRRLRFDMRRAGREPDGYVLVEGLPQYSERRDLYLEEIRAMLRANRHLFES